MRPLLRLLLLLLRDLRMRNKEGSYEAERLRGVWLESWGFGLDNITNPAKQDSQWRVCAEIDATKRRNQNMTLSEMLSRLQGVKGSGSQYTAKCPAHDDRHASLSIGAGDDGRILMKCHAGCSAQSVLAAMGLTERDLFPANCGAKAAKGAKAYHNADAHDGAKVAKGAKAADAPPVVATYNYYGANGELLAQKLRREDKSFFWRRPDGNGGWVYNRQGVTPTLYTAGARELPETVYLVEGEKDVDTLNRINKAAVSGMDGAGHDKWRPEYTEQLRGKAVYILPDNDAVGMEYAQEAASALSVAAKSVSIKVRVCAGGFYTLCAVPKSDAGKSIRLRFLPT